MANPARIHPLPGTGDSGQDKGEWMHDLTPTLSDEAMFNQDGIEPLQVWSAEQDKKRPTSGLRLVDKDELQEKQNSEG
ncbi:MAG: hypothetical protein JJ896_12530 [Rhodothermales bacterium]|nr:hypothetical protein [Rhodothermales bacterium]MBO6780472.1 hypothetical protein [Rhodothermales bacterium]